MILPVIAALSSGIVVKKMQVMPVFSSRFKELWEEWELRGVVFLSLTLQILLICMGNRRKYIHSALFRGVVWLAYLMADSVAIYALGIITNKLTNLNSQSVDADTQLNAFWAPFLLLHLGGPDTITAYALEDNELWLRHLLALLTQAGVTFYIFLMAWNGQKISILTIVVILAGLFKYGERVYVLWTASSEQFRESIPCPPPIFSKILEQHKLMEAEGYLVLPQEVIEIAELQHVPEIRNVIEENIMDGANLLSRSQSYDFESEKGALLSARGLVKIFRRIFADLRLSSEDRHTSESVLKDKDPLTVFKIIEIELGIMYDLLYTKAKVIHTGWGLARRITGLVSICIVLVLFILIEDQNYSVADLSLTFALLPVAILLEICAFAVLLFSDRTACWLIREKKFAVLDSINRLRPLTERRRWSDHMAQFSLLSFAFKEKYHACHRLLEILHIDEEVKKPLYIHHKKVTNDIKNRIVKYIRKLQSLSTAQRSQEVDLLEKIKNLQWTMELEFDQIILIWHIATELLYGLKNEQELPEQARTGKYLSRYMMYILVMHPEMLPTGIGRIRFQETYIEAMKILDGKKREECKLNITRAYDELQGQVNTQLYLTTIRGDISKIVLFLGCRLASQLCSENSNDLLCDGVSSMWVRILCDAAIKCKASNHAQQLRRGGELLTHVWLMLAHFGLTDHFKIPLAPAAAELIVR